MSGVQNSSFPLGVGNRCPSGASTAVVPSRYNVSISGASSLPPECVPNGMEHCASVLGATAHMVVIDERFIPKTCGVLPFLFENILVPHSPREFYPDPCISFRLTWRLDQLVDPYDAPVFTRSPDFTFLNTGCGRQNIIGIGRGFISE